MYLMGVAALEGGGMPAGEGGARHVYGTSTVSIAL